jgi:hypothetical protein
MQAILQLVETRKQQFAALPIFQYIQDQQITPKQRLCWLPCLAPLSLGFGDLWRDILYRQDDQGDPLQILINRHFSKICGLVKPLISSGTRTPPKPGKFA